MPQQQHRGSRRHHRVRVGVAGVVITVCVLLGTAQTLSVLSVPPPAGATTAGGPLQVTMGTFDGDAVTTTPIGSVLAGSDVTYQVAVTNTGTSTQTNVLVPVTLVSSFSLHPASVSISAGTTSTGGGVLSWSAGSLAGGETATLTYTETADAPSSLESDSTTAAATSDQSTAPSTTTTGLGVVPAADLEIAVSDGVDTVAPGASDTYTITLTDDGPSAVTNATVTDTFSSDVGALGGSSSLGDASFTDLGGGQGAWTGVSLASGASATFEVGATLPTTLSPGSAVVDVATVALAPGQVDTAPTYNAFDSDLVTGGAGTGTLAVAVASSDGDTVTLPSSESVLAGSDVTYEVTVTNEAAAVQTHVSVPVTPPPAFTLSSGLTTSAGTASDGEGVVTWSIPSLAAGASATLHYTETADAPASTETDTTSASATSDQSTSAVATSDAVEVIPASGLSVTVDDGVDTVVPGASLTYTVTVTNDGPSAAADATVNEAFDAGFSALFAVSSLSGTSFSDVGPDQFAWTGVNLAGGASATFSLMGNVATDVPSGGAFVDVATAGLPPGQVDTGAPSTGFDADEVVAAPQAITFSAPATGIAGHSVTLAATGGGSGNPVVFSADPSSGAGVCSVSGTNGATLSFTAAGTCVVDADQAGNASFAAAPTVSASVEVEQAPAFTADTPPTTGTAGQSYAYTFAADGAPAPSFALAAGAPSWLSLDAGSGALSGTPPSGTTSFTYAVVATNVVGSVTAGPFSVTLAQPADPPVVDLSAALSCPGTSAVGTEGECTLTVHNAGPGTAESVTAAIVLPFRLRLVGAPGSSRWFGNGGAWWLGNLAPDASASFSATFRAVAPGRAIVVGGALSIEPGPSPADAFTSAPVVVTGGGAGSPWTAGPLAASSHRAHGRR